MKASDQIASKIPVRRESKRGDGRKKPGLLHSTRVVEVQEVRTAMRLACVDCGKLPQVRRLVVRTGAGRYGKSEVRDIVCGRAWLQRRAQEYFRADEFLRLGFVDEPGRGIRL